MNPSEEVAFELVNALIDRTKAGSVKWESNPTINAFVYFGTSASVQVGSKDGDGAWPYTFDIYDSVGTPVQTLVTGYDSSGNDYDVSDPREWNDAVEALYFAARIAAFDLDGLAASILEDIDEGRTAPPTSPSANPKADDSKAKTDDADLDDLPF